MIHGEKVILRAIELSDAETMYKWINDREVTRTLGMTYPRAVHEEERWIAELAQKSTERHFAITYNGVLIGSCGLMGIDWVARKAELGIMIGEKDYQNKGLGKDAVRALVSFAFGEMNLHKVFLRVLEDNKRAIACYEKCGFVKEGLLIDDVFKEGRYHNHLIMAIISR